MQDSNFKPNLLLLLNRIAEKPAYITLNTGNDVFGFTVGETFLPPTLIYAHREGCMISQNDRETKLRNGSFLILNKNEKFSISKTGTTGHGPVLLLFKRNFISDTISENISGKIFPADWNFHSLIREMSSGMKRISSDFQWGEEKFFEVLLHLNSLGNKIESEMANLNHLKRSSRMETYRKLNRAKDFIRTYYDEKLNLDDISREAGLSKYYLIKLFKELYRLTPYEFLLRQRMIRACEMLRTEKKSITNICYDTGFESPSSFSLLFKKHTGLSPREYRNLSLNY